MGASLGGLTSLLVALRDPGVGCVLSQSGSFFEAGGEDRAWRWFERVVGAADRAPESYRIADFGAPTVLLMGSEREGLSPEQQAVCDRMVSIPMRGRADSLNAAVAGAVLAYALTQRVDEARLTEALQAKSTGVANAASQPVLARVVATVCEPIIDSQIDSSSDDSGLIKID